MGGIFIASDNEIILGLLKESRDAVKELAIAVTKLEKGIVGQINCDVYRRDFNTRLFKVEKCVTILCSERGSGVSELDLHTATDDVIQRVTATENGKLDDHETRLQSLEADRRFVTLTWKMVWGNQVAKSAVVAVVLVLIGIYSGRVQDYGWHIVVGFLGSVLLVSLYGWIRNRENREKAKKVMGLQ